MYDYKRINTFLQNHTGKVDPKDKDSAFIFNLYFDLSIYRVVILMHEDYELDLSQGSFSELLGYGKSILSGDSVGRKVPNITRGVDWVYLHCDLVTRRTNNVLSDVLYGFSTTDLQVSYPFKIEPRRLEWQTVNKSYIDKISVWVTDGRNNILDLNGTDIAISLMIEKEQGFCWYKYTVMNHPSEWARFFDENTGSYRFKHIGSGVIRHPHDHR